MEYLGNASYECGRFALGGLWLPKSQWKIGMGVGWEGLSDEVSELNGDESPGSDRCLEPTLW